MKISKKLNTLLLADDQIIPIIRNERNIYRCPFLSYKTFVSNLTKLIINKNKSNNF